MRAVERTAAIATIIASLIAGLTYFGVRYHSSESSTEHAQSQVEEPGDTMSADILVALQAAKGITSPWRRDDTLARLVGTALDRRESRAALAAADAISGPGTRDDMLYQVVLYGILVQQYAIANQAAGLISSPWRADKARELVSDHGSGHSVARRPFVIPRRPDPVAPASN